MRTLVVLGILLCQYFSFKLLPPEVFVNQLAPGACCSPFVRAV